MAYKTKPIDCWQKAKELSAWHYNSAIHAKEEGRLLVVGGAGLPYEVVAGFGEFASLQGEPYAARVGHVPDFATECAEEVERRGFARELCSYMRMYWGSMFLGRTPWGPFPKPDFGIQLQICDTHGKWFQQVCEHFDVPYYCLDIPWYNSLLAGRKKRSVEYVVQQFEEFIEQAEKDIGLTFDDEKLIKATINGNRTETLWSEICNLQKSVPAPLGIKDLYTLYVPVVQFKHTDEAWQYYEVLLDEVKDRVANQIAAVENERCRLIHENLPPWHTLRILRFFEQYGVVLLGSRYLFFNWGLWQIDEKGEYVPRPSLEKAGQVPRNRQEALTYLATRYLDRDPSLYDWNEAEKMGMMLVQQWQAGGYIVPNSRGCETQGPYFQYLCDRLRQLGIPSMIYESNNVDNREFLEGDVLDRFEAFLEGLGLTKLGT